MNKAVYPGKFDPITNETLNIIKRANKLFDQLIIAICINKNIKYRFSPEERKDMILKNISKEIKVEYYDGLIIDFMQKINSNLIIKGLRSLSNFELEFQKAQMNKKMDKNIETIFLPCKSEYNYLSSGLVREISDFKVEVKDFVPENVQEKLNQEGFKMGNFFTVDEMEIGQKASFSKTITEADVTLYAGITGDLNPAHINEEFAKNTMFKGRIAHGMLGAGLISAVLGTKLPGPGTIYISQNLKFTAPVQFGDTVTATVRVKSKDEEKNRVVMETICTTQDGKEVITGEAVLMPPKK